MSDGSDSDFAVGPIDPATNTFLGEPTPAPSRREGRYSSATLRAIRAPSRAISRAKSSQRYSFWLMRLAENVLVVMMSAPASM